MTETEQRVLTDLLEYPNWVRVRVTPDEKYPVGPSGRRIDATDPDNLHYLDELSFEKGGVPAFQLGIEERPTPFIGVDFDDVAEDRKFVSDDVASIVMGAPAGYREWSVSGTGAHCVSRGELLGGYKATSAKAFGSLDVDAHVELYDSNRYFVLTGDALTESTPEPRANEDYWQEFQRDNFEKKSPKSESDTNQFSDAESTVTASSSMVRYTLDQYAKSNSGLSQFAQDTLQLWTSTPDRKESGVGHEDDLAFCNRLRFWCRGDPALIRVCWEASERWDQKCAKYPDCYVEKTIQTALERVGNDETFRSEYLTPPKGCER